MESSFVSRGGEAVSQLAQRSRFEKFKTKHRNSFIVDIDGALMRRHAQLTRGARSLYSTMRVLADGRTGKLVVNDRALDWRFICREAEISRCTWLKRFRELISAGFAGSERPRVLRVINGRKRIVLGRACYFVYRQAIAHEIAENRPFLLKSTLSTVEEVDPQVLSEAPKSRVKSPKKEKKETSLPSARVTPRSPEPEVQKAKSAAFRSVLPDVTEKQKQNNPDPSVQGKPEPQPKFRPDLTLTTVLAILEKYFLTSDDVRSWMNVEERWRNAGGPVDRALLVKFLDDAITSMSREGLLYHPVVLLRLKQLRRHEFSPRLSAPSTSLRFTPAPGSCSRCGGEGIAVKNGVGSYCECVAGKQLMFPNRR
jgi:hypothetical protein